MFILYRFSAAISEHEIKAIFHTASYGMSGTSNLPAYEDIVEQVNLGGSRNVLKAAIQYNVEALGKEI